MMVRSNAVAGRDEDYNRWYDEQHVPDLLATPRWLQRNAIGRRIRPSDAFDASRVDCQFFAPLGPRVVPRR